MTTFITQTMLGELVEEARQTPRQRKNRNFHPDNDYPAHRLLNAIEPGSYIMPHCHQAASKDETIVCLRGKLGVVIFDTQGQASTTRVLSADGDTLGVDIPHGVFHSVLALAPATVFFEAKAGPYQIIADNEIAPWAPREGDAAAPAYYQQLRQLFPQDLA